MSLGSIIGILVLSVVLSLSVDVYSILIGGVDRPPYGAFIALILSCVILYLVR